MSGPCRLGNNGSRTSLSFKSTTGRGRAGPGRGLTQFSERSYFVSTHSSKSLIENTDIKQWERSEHYQF